MINFSTGEGIGKWLTENYTRVAPDLGYKAMFFNLVFEINKAMIRIVNSLGLPWTGQILKAVKLDDGRYIDVFPIS